VAAKQATDRERQFEIQNRAHEPQADPNIDDILAAEQRPPFLEGNIRCGRCGHFFTVRRTWDKAGQPVHCPRCRGVGKSPYSSDESPAVTVELPADEWSEPAKTERLPERPTDAGIAGQLASLGNGTGE